MHNPFDQLAKKVGKGALDTSGVTVVQYEIARDAQHADLRHEPDPARGAERARLGLLGRIASALCLIEVFGHGLAGAELRASLSKHFAHWEDCARRTRAQNQRRQHKGLPPEPNVEPILWIIAAAVSAPMLRKLNVEPARGWPPSVYFFGDDLLRVGIIVARELPRDRSTLLVRIMAGGPLLADAIADLAGLPLDAPERTVAEEILVDLQHRLGRKQSRTPEEEEFIMSMHSTWEKARIEGRDEAVARAVLTVLRARGIDVPEKARELILAQSDPEQLERWLERAAVAASVAEVIDDLS
jgi:hypothetical protein